TRKTFDKAKWDWLESRLYYTSGNFTEPAAFANLKNVVQEIGGKIGAQGNTLVYLAISPSLFELVTQNLDEAGFKNLPGWIRIIVEKPFGRDLQSAIDLNKALLSRWREDQIYRIDHYLGKETVQNLLSFRFSNRIFEPVWNKNEIDNIQISVIETVGVEGRGGYYDTSGVLRDMIQNHMFQMLAYVCMEAPASFSADAIRDEKAKLLHVVRAPNVARDCVRGQYGPGVKPDGTPILGYREEPKVPPTSRTETFAAMKLYVDNWRWEGVPVYLRSGKSLWKRGTEVIVQFKNAPDVLFRDTPAAGSIRPNLLVFHIQPDQAVEFRVHAKRPGPHLSLQKVDMRFDYSQSFEAARGTGYEVLLYSAMNGDATLFSRSDFVEAAWRIAQPMLDTWSQTPADEFPNYSVGTWGPRSASDLLTRDGRCWHEIVNREVLARNAVLKEASPIFLHNLALCLTPRTFDKGETIIEAGDTGRDMFYICQGEVEVFAADGTSIGKLCEGQTFGEISLLLNVPRSATIKASRQCALFVLKHEDYERVTKDFPKIDADLRALALTRKAHA
ncbi:MAG TPA: glucose-6-phosphate dehydrogenase, partial [Planctomycetaceae bacterium]